MALPEPTNVTEPVGEYPVTVAVHVEDVPTVTVDGVQPTLRLLCAWFTVTWPLFPAVEVLVAKFKSPEYVAPIKCGEPLTLRGVYNTEQKAEVDGGGDACNTQLLAVKLPRPVIVNEPAVPVGGPPELGTTTIVQVEGIPT